MIILPIVIIPGKVLSSRRKKGAIVTETADPPVARQAQEPALFARLVRVVAAQLLLSCDRIFPIAAANLTSGILGDRTAIVLVVILPPLGGSPTLPTHRLQSIGPTA